MTSGFAESLFVSFRDARKHKTVGRSLRQEHRNVARKFPGSILREQRLPRLDGREIFNRQKDSRQRRRHLFADIEVERALDTLVGERLYDRHGRDNPFNSTSLPS